MAGSDKRYEEDNTTGINHEGARANTPVERLTAKSIIGDGVENEHRETLGTVENLVINIRKGTVDYAVLDLGSLLGIGGRLFAIPFTALRLNAQSRVFVLAREKEYLEKSPGFSREYWPEAGDAYFRAVDLYWQ